MIYPVLRCFLLAVAAALIPSVASAAGLTLYVSPKGNDAWSGRAAEPNAARTDGPLATLAKARDVIRKRKAAGLPAGGATVLVRGGIYCLAETLKLGAEDSGTADAPVVYRACPGEKPIVMGARAIRDFTPHEGPVLKADVGRQGFKGIYFRQLIFAGRRQHLARWPNFDPQNPYGGGWTYVDGVDRPMYADIPGEDRRTLRYKPQDDRPWSRPEEGQVFIFARYNWWNDIVRIAGRDRATRTITLAGNCSYPPRAGDRYYVENLREELDAPGEWYLDRQTWTLYFWPPEPLAGRAVYAPVLKTIVELNQAAHVTLRGLVIEGCEGTAVVLSKCTECLVAGCTIRNVGDYRGSGASLAAGRHNGVVGCDIHDTGSNAVGLSGGDAPTLTAAENYADNNYIHHVGVYYKQGVGVAMSGVGNRASHNLIHDTPRMGIMFGGNNLVIEYNHIRHANLETEDTGAVYTGGRDWLGSRGTVIRYNYFHDILGYGRRDGKWISPHFAWGVYLDDNTGGVDVIGNIVVRAHRAGIHLHNGRDNHVENNIFVDGRPVPDRVQRLDPRTPLLDHPPADDDQGLRIRGRKAGVGQDAQHEARSPRRRAAGRNDHVGQRVFPEHRRGQRPRGEDLTATAPCRWETQQVRPQPAVAPGAADHHGSVPREAGRGGRTWSPTRASRRASRASSPSRGGGRDAPEGCDAVSVASGADAGQRCLRITGGMGKDPQGRPQATAVVSSPVPMKPGQAYRLQARVKADRPGLKATLAIQSYVAKVYYWSKQVPVKPDGQWKTFELVFQVPAKGEQPWRPEMKAMCVRIDFGEPGSTLCVDGVDLRGGPRR